MKFTYSLLALLLLASSIRADTDCSDLQAQCSEDAQCEPPLANAAQCMDSNNLNNDPYGCAQFNADNTNYGVYGASCVYNCFGNASIGSNSTLFNSVVNCTQTELLDDSCPGQFENCYNTTLNNLNCISNLNTLANCESNNLTLAGCAQANEDEAETKFPAYMAQCDYNCYNSVNQPNNAFTQLYNCGISQALLFPSGICTASFMNCLADSTQVCVGYLNTATINVQNSAACAGSATNSNSNFITACANQTYTSVPVTNTSAAWTNLTGCLLSLPTPSPSPSPSSNSTTPSSGSGSTNTTSSSSSSSSYALMGVQFLIICVLSMFLL